MNRRTNANPAQTAKYFAALVFYTVAFAINALAQSSAQFGEEVKFTALVYPLANSGGCLYIDKMVYNEETLKKLLSWERCRDNISADKIDLKKQTVIGWQAASDCHMRVETRLYRNDKEKLFTLVIKNFYGGCRAGGSREGLIATDKIPADHKIKFIEYRIDGLYDKTPRSSVKSEETWSADGQKLEAKTREQLDEINNKSLLNFFSDAGTPEHTDESEVEIRRKSDFRRFTCKADLGGVYTEEEYKVLLANKECSFPQVDLTKESMIGFGTSGDCHVRGEAKVFRNDKTKTYTIQVNTIYGGCRAAGSYRGWIVIEKMRPDYQVKWTRLKTEEGGVPEVDDRFPPELVTLETKEIEIKGCIQLNRSRDITIKDDASLLAAIRQDASNDFCRKELKNIDLGKYTLFGTHIVSDYCDRPTDLTHKIVRDDEKKTYTFQVKYSAPEGLCRRLGQYDLWVLAPKAPAGYEISFDIQSPDRKQN